MGYLGFCEIAVHAQNLMPYVVDLHAIHSRQTRMVEVHLSEQDLVFVDTKSQRPLRRFEILSIVATEAVLPTAAAGQAYVTMARYRADSGRTFVHVFATKEVGRRRTPRLPRLPR